MSSPYPDDPVAESLHRLSRLTPDADRAERVRMQCRAGLKGGRRREPQMETDIVDARAVMTRAGSWRLVPPVVVGAVCVLYAVALVVTTLRLEGLLR
jgi:hypothetical protein